MDWDLHLRQEFQNIKGHKSGTAPGEIGQKFRAYCVQRESLAGPFWAQLELAQNNVQKNDTFPFLPVPASIVRLLPNSYNENLDIALGKPPEQLQVAGHLAWDINNSVCTVI
ncbi:hypothetical protein NC651_020317 [Populus alba x Populus x berolinensis]|nr:hypothetical protein NC651_020317 [Populus alba x Populus x berolinensis]